VIESNNEARLIVNKS